MRNIKLLSSLLLLSAAFTAAAQDYNPYKAIGKKGNVVTLTHGKYVEHFDTDSLQRMGSVIINTRTKKIVRLLNENDTTFTNSSPSRWLAIDPLASKYPSISPYAFCANNPILYKDPDGREIRIAFRTQDEAGAFSNHYVTYRGGKLYSENGSRYKGNDGYVLQVTKDIDLVKKDDKELSRRVGVLQDSKEIHTISDPKLNGRSINSTAPESEDNVANHKPTGSDVEYDPFNRDNGRGEDRTPRVGLAHDLLGHGYDYDQGTARAGQNANGVELEEVDAVKVENLSRKSTGDPQKTTYGGVTIPAAELSAPLQDVKKP
ncbi:RHS repeat-associated core domain-containing protein [Taibaiella soli]|uniref:hypothetical protein n=1 Tax=Taibaiella soli TaxID=1649169 RepID=UPI001A9E03A6|nr:hypothetical protein [Taibaiella soli]